MASRRGGPTPSHDATISLDVVYDSGEELELAGANLIVDASRERGALAGLCQRGIKGAP